MNKTNFKNPKYTDQEKARRQKLKNLLFKNIPPYAAHKPFTHTSQTVTEALAPFSATQLEVKKEVLSTAGRLMTRRGPFFVLQDSTGTTQCYVNNKLHPAVAGFVHTLDRGDIVWVSGHGMKTKTNQPTIFVFKVQLLTKSLRPLPNKFNALTDKEVCRRYRALDLIVNPATRHRFSKRAQIIKSIRTFLDEKNFTEVSTPVLQPLPGGAVALPFKTHYAALNTHFYLRVATELPLKKLIVGGMSRVYELGPVFRNEGIDATHNPEFTSLEFYAAYSDLAGIMATTEQLVGYVAKRVGVTSVILSGRTVRFTPPFARVSMCDAIKNVVGVDFKKIKDLGEASKVAAAHKVPCLKTDQVGNIIFAFFEKYVEPTLIQPTFVTGFPLAVSPLAARVANEPQFTHRAELFVNGQEIANMFSELTDPGDQFDRFVAQQKKRSKGDQTSHPLDMDFVTNLEYGLPPTGGCGVGVDRLVMLLTDAKSIADVILFPHRKPKAA